MDSARKRKASNATPTTAEGAGGAAKRLKLLNTHPAPASPSESSVQRVGFKLLNQLRNAADKTGRSVSGAFLELPPRDEYADYYQAIKLPIALETIEAKVKRDAYPTVSALESDVKRMIQNAKDYNMPKSEIFEDAERIRKLVYNFMKVNNPAYSTDPNYTAVPTPIPQTRLILTNGSRDYDHVKDEPASRDASVKPRASMAAKNSEPLSDRKSSLAPSATTGDGGAGYDLLDGQDLDFTGKSFQDAQQMIVAELIRHTDAEGLAIYTPFVNLPSRSLLDYYKVIKHPVSLKSVQKRTRGEHGRNPPTEITDFKTWDAFEQDVSWIWRNAQIYNEDGSDMYNLASEFEEHFKTLLDEAKEIVEEPAKPSLKLGGPKPPATKSGITLSLSQHRGSPVPGVSVDNEALLRQRQMVAAGVNGHQSQGRSTATLNGIGRTSSHYDGRPSSSTHVGSPPAGGIKNEKFSTLSPGPHATQAGQPVANGMMPPPMVRAPSSSQHVPSSNLPYVNNNNHYTAPALLPPAQLRSYPASQALLPVVTIATHPQLKVSKPLNLAVPPHEILSHQSTTVTIPSTHYYLQIAPTISRELSMGRAYKMFVIVNGTRLTQRDTQFHADTGKRTHVYEGSLASGVNRIEVEVAAARADGTADSKGLDIEKVVVYANLMKQT